MTYGTRRCPLDDRRFDQLIRSLATMPRRSVVGWLLGATFSLSAQSRVAGEVCSEESQCCFCRENQHGAIICTDRVGASCDDGDPCTVDDVCRAGGLCKGRPKTCAASSRCEQVAGCDAVTGECLFTSKPDGPTAGCSGPVPGAPCREHACRGGMCLSLPKQNGTACPSDDNSCTDDICTNGLCTHPPLVNETPCSGGTCQNGTCVDNSDPDPEPACRTGWKRCGGRCVDSNRDERNCGRCGKRCARGERCRRGRCRS